MKSGGTGIPYARKYALMSSMLGIFATWKIVSHILARAIDVESARE
jgi:hypothetical protein